MRRTLLAFFGLSFVIYWLWTAELPIETAASLGPVVPSIVRLPNREIPQPSTPLPNRPAQGALPLKSTSETWLKAEALRMGRIDSDPAASLKRLQRRAHELRAQELLKFAQTALNPKANGDQRFLAVYMIGLSNSPSSLDLLKQINYAPVPHPANDREYSEEVIIRAQALESVVHKLPRKEVRQYLKQFLATSSDPAVARHANYWLSQFD